MLSSALFVTVGGQLIVSMFEITQKPDQNFIQLMVILVSILPGICPQLRTRIFHFVLS